MKKVILTIVFVAIAAAFVHDVSYYAKARYDLNNIAMETADRATATRKQTRDQNAREAAQYAASRGATLFQYDERGNRAYVWVQMPVQHTWVLGPAMALLASQPVDTAYLIHIEKSGTFK